MKKSRARSKRKVRFTAPDFSKLVAELDASTFITALGAVSRLFPEPQTQLERVVCALVSRREISDSVLGIADVRSVMVTARSLCAEMSKPGGAAPPEFPTFDPAHVIMTRTQFEAALRAALRDGGNDYCHWDEYASKVEELTAHVCRYMDKYVNE